MDPAITGQIVSEHRQVLFRYALLKLQNNEAADDVVQETLLAALQSTAKFTGKSSIRTWLIGILKHKIADYWRNQGSEMTELNSVDTDNVEICEDDDHFFAADGHWISQPKSWCDPEAALNQQEFWSIYEICQKNLPPTMAQVFILRELVGLEADEICLEVGIMEGNYWVTMHRARLRLRECLEVHWFNSNKKEKKHA